LDRLAPQQASSIGNWLVASTGISLVLAATATLKADERMKGKIRPPTDQTCLCPQTWLTATVGLRVLIGLLQRVGRKKPSQPKQAGSATIHSAVPEEP
jgi:hypothetical protein